MVLVSQIENSYLPIGRTQQIEEHENGCRFSRPIGTQKPEDLPLVCLKGDVIYSRLYRLSLPKLSRQVFYFDDNLFHKLPSVNSWQRSLINSFNSFWNIS